jgi:hypothetical protein
MGTLDYQSPPEIPKPSLSPAPPLLFGTLSAIAGIVALSEDFKWFSLMTTPNFNWGPNQYVLSLMWTVAVGGSGFITIGAMLFLDALRRCRK